MNATAPVDLAETLRLTVTQLEAARRCLAVSDPVFLERTDQRIREAWAALDAATKETPDV